MERSRSDLQFSTVRRMSCVPLTHGFVGRFSRFPSTRLRCEVRPLCPCDPDPAAENEDSRRQLPCKSHPKDGTDTPQLQSRPPSAFKGLCSIQRALPAAPLQMLGAGETCDLVCPPGGRSPGGRGRHFGPSLCVHPRVRAKGKDTRHCPLAVGRHFPRHALPRHEDTAAGWSSQTRSCGAYVLAERNQGKLIIMEKMIPGIDPRGEAYRSGNAFQWRGRGAELGPNRGGASQWRCRQRAPARPREQRRGACGCRPGPGSSSGEGLWVPASHSRGRSQGLAAGASVMREMRGFTRSAHNSISR